MLQRPQRLGPVHAVHADQLGNGRAELPAPRQLLRTIDALLDARTPRADLQPVEVRELALLEQEDAELQAGMVHAKSSNAVRIGYVDINRVLNEVEDGKSAVVKLKTDFERKQKQLDKMQTDLKAKKEQFDKRSAMMKPDVKVQKERELQAEFMQVQETYMKPSETVLPQFTNR